MDDFMEHIISLISSTVISIATIITTERVITYRVKQLENKVQKHNELIQRMYIVETKINDIEREVYK